MRWRLSVLIGLLLAVPNAAAADAVFVASSPGVNASVGERVDSIEIVFNEVVTNAVITIEGPVGEVPINTKVSNGQVVSAGFESLTIEGPYLVRYSVISADTDPVDGGFSFNYAAGAPAPLPVSVPAIADDGISNWVLAAAAIGGLLITLLVLQVLDRTRRLRKLTPQ